MDYNKYNVIELRRIAREKNKNPTLKNILN